MELRKSVLSVLIILYFGLAAGEVYYEVGADKSQAVFDTKVQLDCSGADCPVESWTLTLNKPNNANITNVEALQGELENYEVHGDKIFVQTKSNRPSRTETVEVSYRIDRDAEEVEDGLYIRTVSLPGFSGKANSGKVEVEDLISASGSYGFKTGRSNETFKFRGEGPSNVKVSFGEGYETKYYEFFGEKPDETDIAYEVSIGTLGFDHRSDRLPAAALSNAKYNRTVNRWSSGRYVDGYIALRDDLEEDFLPILAHETVHALNEQHLKWDRTSSKWFDEGTSKYVEFLMKKSMRGQDKTPELFGNKVSYVQRHSGDRYRYTLPPKGDKEQLWQYYNENMSFMKGWSSASEQRSFGYAYSELIIREYISRNNSLAELYEVIDPGREIETNDEKWDHYSQHLDLKPCKYESREKFESCIERVNSYEYPIYTAEPGNDTRDMEVEELNVSNRSGFNSKWNDSPRRENIGIQAFLVRALENFSSMIRSLATSL